MGIHDEIGQLVKQYNFMVMELEKSAEILKQMKKKVPGKQNKLLMKLKPINIMKLSVQILKNPEPKDPNFKKN